MDRQEMMNGLEKLAYKKSTPFCYHCYRAAPSGRCAICASDDLMRQTQGGCEYGVDWVIRELLCDDLTPVNEDEAFEESVRQCYPEEITVLWMTLDAVTVAKDSDPVSWSLARSEWLDSEVNEETIVTFDNGSTHYYAHDIETYLDAN